jgi:hypothetical protein
LTRVDLPDPDGAEMMKRMPATVVSSVSFSVPFV